MALLEILKYPNPLLKKKARAVKRVDNVVRALIADMIQTMHEAPGVGLAAPQVGRSIRLIVVDVDDGPIALINPKIKKRSGEQVFIEGCLSVPNLEAPVKRAERITVQGLTRYGKTATLEAEGLIATVLQHEIDHLDGKLFIDRVTDPADIRPMTRSEAAQRDKVCIEGRSEECMM
jgi:peptide deformylase